MIVGAGTNAKHLNTATPRFRKHMDTSAPPVNQTTLTDHDDRLVALAIQERIIQQNKKRMDDAQAQSVSGTSAASGAAAAAAGAAAVAQVKSQWPGGSLPPGMNWIGF